jgi:hypothetical protein
VTAPDFTSLEAIIRAGDAPAVREQFANATEGERRVLAKALKPLFERPDVDASEDEWQKWRGWSHTAAFAAAGIAVAGGYRSALSVLEQPRRWELAAGDYDVFAGVLADRNPAWLGELIDRMLARPFDHIIPSWPLARRLVRLGVIDRPDAEEYGVKMIESLAQTPPPYWRVGAQSPQELIEAFGTGGGRLATVLLDDPGLLEDEVWRLFTIPGVGKEMEGNAYYAYLPLGAQWAEALARLAAQGHLDSGRLIDCCLDAFLRDFPPNHVAWYAQLHDRLQPSVAKKAERSERYLALLAAPSKPGVTVGQRGCAELLDAGLLDATAFLAASPPALIYPQKSVATAQLKIIGKLTARQPLVREAALATAAQAFGHQREDVQAAAVQLIGKYGVPADGAVRATIMELAAFLSPVLRPEATALGLAPDQAPDAAPARQVPAGPVASSVSLTPSVQRVVPVTDPAELVQLLAWLMEDASNPLDVERALDGAVRLSALPLPDRARLAEPLLKRARQHAATDPSGPFSGYWPRADMASLTLTWATGEMPQATANIGHGLVGNKWRHGATPKSLSGILSARGWEACALIADGHGFPLLATPEYDDRSISHDELLARLARWPGGPGPADGPRPPRNDIEVAMLRLAPGAEAILPDDLLAAYAPAQVPLSIEPDIALPKETEHTRPGLPGLPGETWHTVDAHAAALARYVGSDQAISPEFSRCGWVVTYLQPGSRFLPRGLANEVLRSNEHVAAWPLLAPHHPELIAAHLLRPLAAGLIPGRSAASAAVRVVARLRGSVGIIGHIAVVAGLASAEADARIAAAETWGQLAQEGRLDPGLAAEAISFGVSTRLRVRGGDPAVRAGQADSPAPAAGNGGPGGSRVGRPAAPGPARRPGSGEGPHQAHRGRPPPGGTDMTDGRLSGIGGGGRRSPGSQGGTGRPLRQHYLRWLHRHDRPVPWLVGASARADVHH